jgi:hypothetical protein
LTEDPSALKTVLAQAAKIADATLKVVDAPGCGSRATAIKTLQGLAYEGDLIIERHIGKGSATGPIAKGDRAALEARPKGVTGDVVMAEAGAADGAASPKAVPGDTTGAAEAVPGIKEKVEVREGCLE